MAGSEGWIWYLMSEVFNEQLGEYVGEKTLAPEKESGYPQHYRLVFFQKGVFVVKDAVTSTIQVIAFIKLPVTKQHVEEVLSKNSEQYSKDAVEEYILPHLINLNGYDLFNKKTTDANLALHYILSKKDPEPTRKGQILPTLHYVATRSMKTIDDFMKAIFNIPSSKQEEFDSKFDRLLKIQKTESTSDDSDEADFEPDGASK
jgi:hypothetical protein